MHDHSHKFDPANAARLDDPRRDEFMPRPRLVAALPLSSGERVADIGCGSGFWLRALLDASPAGVRFFGVDTSQTMLDMLATRLEQHPRRGDVSGVLSTEGAVPLPDAGADVVVMGSVYHELADRKAFLAELRRLLAPGGRLAIVDWDVLPDEAERTMGPPSDHRVAAATAEAELVEAGFCEPERVEGFRESWCLIARR